MQTSSVCPHGHLARSCEICELDAHAATLLAQLAEAEKRIAWGVTERGLLEDLLMEKNKKITELEKLVSENAADSLKWRTMFQNERDHMNAALLEIERLKSENARLREYCRPCDLAAADAAITKETK